jgi:hypothetical protein
MLMAACEDVLKSQKHFRFSRVTTAQSVNNGRTERETRCVTKNIMAVFIAVEPSNPTKL